MFPPHILFSYKVYCVQPTVHFCCLWNHQESFSGLLVTVKLKCGIEKSASVAVLL